LQGVSKKRFDRLGRGGNDNEEDSLRLASPRPPSFPYLLSAENGSTFPAQPSNFRMLKQCNTSMQSGQCACRASCVVPQYCGDCLFNTLLITSSFSAISIGSLLARQVTTRTLAQALQRTAVRNSSAYLCFPSRSRICTPSCTPVYRCSFSHSSRLRQHRIAVV
jgi:hypothetical protein